MTERDLDDAAPTDVRQWLSEYVKDDNFFWRTATGHQQNVLDELIEMANELYGLAFRGVMSIQRHERTDSAVGWLMGVRVDRIGDVLGCAPQGGPRLSSGKRPWIAKAEPSTNEGELK